MNDFQYKKVCSNLLSKLSERQKSIVSRRFALGQEEKETLESIGEDFDICRERVRQIEQAALKELEERGGEYSNVFSAFINYLKKFGGLRKERVLLRDLGEDAEKELFFLLNIKSDFKRKKENKDFYSLWALNDKYYSKAKETIREIIETMQEEKELMDFEELQSLTSEEEKALKSYLEVSKRIQRNAKNLYGLSNWPEINPKGVKDKAYLAFKKAGEPLHFSKVSQLIEGSNVQTVHNELIKNDKFILVGRGMYALAEWGYRPGKVKDVIERTLKNSDEPLDKEEILEEVLDKRLVKKNTVLLNLGDKDKFEKKPDGKYDIKSA